MFCLTNLTENTYFDLAQSRHNVVVWSGSALLILKKKDILYKTDFSTIIINIIFMFCEWNKYLIENGNWKTDVHTLCVFYT